MNLQEVLDYRKECLICGNELVFIHKILSIKLDLDGLECHDSNIAPYNFFRLNFDGKIFVDKTKSPIVGFKPNLNLIKACARCNRGQGVPRDYGLSSVIETMCNQYHYSFDIDVKNGLFKVQKNHEFVSYMTRGKFYHIETSFIKQESRVYFGERLEGMYHKTLPIINLQNIKTSDAFVNKIKMLATFS